MNKLLTKTQSLQKDDPYFLHRVVLKPILPAASEEDLFESCKLIKQIGESAFANFLDQQGLASMWHRVLLNASKNTPVSDHFIETLHQSRLLATSTYLLQSQGLRDIKSTLDNENIEHVVFKGCHVRECIYDEPAIRPACDIDVLISPGDQVKAIQALVNAGYQAVPDPEIISHEISLVKGGIAIDLHWDIMRPGRTRIPMTEILLKTRKEFSIHWGLNNDTTLFLMLVHPVFTKYSTTPHSTLVRIVDMAHWIEIKKLDWKQLSTWLEEAGMQTAAWITMEWLRQLTQIVPSTSFTKYIQPGKLRTKYLRYWITNNFSSLFINYPRLIQIAFTLPAHDSLTDAIQATMTMQKTKKSAPRKMNELTAI